MQPRDELAAILRGVQGARAVLTVQVISTDYGRQYTLNSYRGVTVQLPAEHTPLVDFVAALDICPGCGGQVCDCITPDEMAALLARLDADPHGDLSIWQDCEIPF